MKEGYNTASEFLKDLQNELINITTWAIPIFVDGKKIKDVNLAKNKDGEYIIDIKTINK